MGHLEHGRVPFLAADVLVRVSFCEAGFGLSEQQQLETMNVQGSSTVG